MITKRCRESIKIYRKLLGGLRPVSLQNAHFFSISEPSELLVIIHSIKNVTMISFVGMENEYIQTT